MVKLMFHGHSCWEVASDSHRVIIDPFLTDNPAATNRASASNTNSRAVIVMVA